MKFACEQCKTKYSIADERVRGKVLKIRCKHCGHIMTVREEPQPRSREKGVLEQAMEQALTVPPSAAFHGSDATLVATPVALLGSRASPPPLDPEEWHISVDGVAHGPLRLEALAQRIILERAAGDQELFVWRDGFDDWQPPREVPEVRVAVERLRPGLPPDFWGTPEPLFKAAATRGPVVSTHPVDRIESFEFEEEPPTVSVPRKETAALAQTLGTAGAGGAAQRRQPTGGTAPSAARAPAAPVLPTAPLAARTTGGPAKAEPRAPALRPVPPALPDPEPPTPTPASASMASISDVLAHLDDDDPAPPGPPPSGVSVELNITEPSQIIDLRALAGAVRPAVSETPELPGLELPPEPVVPPVLVMSGPAPPAPGRHLKVVLGAAIGACVLLLGLVTYLLLRQPSGKAQVDPSENGKAVTDRPVVVKDDAPVNGPAPAHDPGKKNGNGAAAKRPVKLPAAAAGKTQLNGNAQALAKLYDDGGGKAPALPAVAGGSAAGGGGGVSTAELQEVMRRNQKSLSLCYDRVLKHDDSLRRARIDVQVRVGISGTVTHVSIAPPYGNTELGQCMQQTIRRWHFPPSDSDYETQFPLILTAN